MIKGADVEVTAATNAVHTDVHFVTRAYSSGGAVSASVSATVPGLLLLDSETLRDVAYITRWIKVGKYYCLLTGYSPLVPLYDHEIYVNFFSFI